MMDADDIQVKIDDKAKTMTITVPMTGERPSQSGKTLIQASTGGGARTNTMINGIPVYVNLSVWTNPRKDS